HVVGAGQDDLAVPDRNAAVKFAIMPDDARVLDDQVRLHDARSFNMLSMRLLMPLHWLRPTVIGAREPMPLAQTAFRPSSAAASRSIVPGGAATSTRSACLGKR